MLCVITFVLLSFVVCPVYVCVHFGRKYLVCGMKVFRALNESRSCRRPLTMPLSCDTTDLLSICSDANSCPTHQPKSRMEPLPWRCSLWRVLRAEKWRRERRKNPTCPRRRSLYCRANSPNWLYRLAKQVRGTSCGQLRGDVIWKDKSPHSDTLTLCCADPIVFFFLSSYKAIFSVEECYLKLNFTVTVFHYFLK